MWLGIFAVIGAAFFLSVKMLPSRNSTWKNSQDPIASIANVIMSAISPNDVTILVLGRPGVVSGKAINGDELTDTIMVVHFNADKSKAYLISIPRDLWISDNNEQYKINEMLAKHKVDTAAAKIEEITGLSLDGYVVVDLELVKEAVDYLGGVDVALSRPAVDRVSGYTLSAGSHHLNGDDAVWLIRNRNDKEGDFFREKNQQQIVAEIFSKFEKLSSADKMSFINRFIIKSGLLGESDLDVAKLSGYALDTDLSKVSVSSIVLDFTTKLFKTDILPVNFGTTTQNISILIPSEGFEKYGNIKKYIESELNK